MRKIKAKNFLMVACIIALLILVKKETTSVFGSTCDLLTGDDKSKCQDLESQAQAYQQIIDLKDKQEQSLNNQVDILNAQTGQTQTQITMDQNKIQDVNNQIDDLENKISIQQDALEQQKQMLSDLIQEYAITKQDDPIDVFVSNNNLSNLFGTNDRLAQLEEKVKDLYDNIKAVESNLENEKKSLEGNREEVVSDYSDLQQKNSDLQDTITQKQDLISQTQGEESKYQDLLNRVQQEQAELLDIDALGAGLSADNYPKPPSQYFASTDWYYSQEDPRWANEDIGNSRSLMKSYGCAVTSVAMVFDYYGASITPGALADKPIFSWDLISWPDTWSSPSLYLESGDSHGNVNWNTIDSELSEGNPVIVYIQKTEGSGGHYVVIHHKTADGKYVVHDPYWGPNIYLDTSRALVGLLPPQSGTIIDQMIIYGKQ
jgi:peptidoglycan hydrolase CwlO-like protein